MTNYTKLYWLTRLDNIQGMAVFILIVSGALTIAYFVSLGTAWNDEDKEGIRKTAKPIKRIACFLVPLAVILTTLVPSQKDALFIIAGGKTLDYVQGDSALQNIPGQTTAIISKVLEDKLNELTKETKTP